MIKLVTSPSAKKSTTLQFVLNCLHINELPSGKKSLDEFVMTSIRSVPVIIHGDFFAKRIYMF